jgi:hypothetical protein
MNEQTAKEVIFGMNRDGMPKKTQKKFLTFALKTRGHAFREEAKAVHQDRINEL